MRTFLLSALALSACDPASAPVEPSASANQLYVAGNRIHTRVLVGADGSEKFVGFWDDRAGIPCDVSTASDGQLRCLPPADIMATRSGYYTNSNCTGELASYEGSGTPIGVAPSAPGRQHFQVGPRYTQTVYIDATFNCVAATGIFAPLTDLYEIGARIPAASFVPFVEEIRP